MLKELEKIVNEAEESSGDEEQLERVLRSAAQHLWRAQFLYESDWGVKEACDLIRRHSAYFENLFDALGYRLVGRPVDRYVGLIANELPARQSMKLDETLLLLVMRLHVRALRQTPRILAGVQRGQSRVCHLVRPTASSRRRVIK